MATDNTDQNTVVAFVYGTRRRSPNFAFLLSQFPFRIFLRDELLGPVSMKDYLPSRCKIYFLPKTRWLFFISVIIYISVFNYQDS